MASPRVYADFQNWDDDSRLRLTCAGTRRDLERQGIEPREGTTLTLYSDDANDEGQAGTLGRRRRALQPLGKPPGYSLRMVN